MRKNRKNGLTKPWESGIIMKLSHMRHSKAFESERKLLKSFQKPEKSA
jgi:hypothetical protein